MTNATQTPITIALYAGNFICGASSDAIAAIDLAESVRNYCQQCEAALPEYAISWDVINAEGGSGKIFPDDADTDYINDRMERVFSQGTFWVTNNA